MGKSLPGHCNHLLSLDFSLVFGFYAGWTPLNQILFNILVFRIPLWVKLALVTAIIFCHWISPLSLGSMQGGRP